LKSITIHGLESNLDQKITQRAKEEGISINKAIKKILTEALLGPEQKITDHRDDFRDLFAVWDKEEEEEFNRKVQDFETVNPEEWQ
jgi:plasmid stability protein